MHYKHDTEKGEESIMVVHSSNSNVGLHTLTLSDT